MMPWPTVWINDQIASLGWDGASADHSMEKLFSDPEPMET